jgi:succinoglycan biosynthesis protein ExoV
VLNDIQRSEHWLPEALHGAVVANALRVPWMPVRIYPHSLTFKRPDSCASIGLPYEHVREMPLYQGTSASGKLRGLLGHRLPHRLVSLMARVGQMAAHQQYLSLCHLSAASLQRLACPAQPWLSADHVLETIRDRLQEKHRT